MGARVTINVLLPPNQPVEGAEITGINHDAWSASHRIWRGRTDVNGSFTWANIDTGTLGDRYTFKVAYTDPEGVSWSGSVSERINRPLTLKVTLSPEFSDNKSISPIVVSSLSASKEGERLLASMRELDSALNANLVQSALLLEVAIIELAIRLHLEKTGRYRREWDHLTPAVLVAFKEVDNAIGPTLVSQVRDLFSARNNLVHGPGKESIAALSQQGRATCISVIETLFGPRK